MPESTDRPELSQDALVEALVPDPDHLAEVIMLHGYLGKSAVEGSWRLYLTPALDEYVEIPEDKILHHRRLAEDRGTMVWVPRGLALQHKQIRSEEVQAEFLAGPIASQYLRPDDNSTPLPWLRGPAIISIQLVCFTHFWTCESRLCPSLIGCTNYPRGEPC